jgi:hypothetical protein
VRSQQLNGSKLILNWLYWQEDSNVAVTSQVPELWSGTRSLVASVVPVPRMSLFRVNSRLELLLGGWGRRQSNASWLDEE